MRDKPTLPDLPLLKHKQDRSAQKSPYRAATRSFAKSDVGRHRKENEDSFFCDDTLQLYMVADGMGGHAAGEIASQEAVDTVFGMVKRGLIGIGSTEPPLSDEVGLAACRMLESAIQAATYMIFAMGELDQSKAGMGTTISVALFIGDSLVTGQVGDSRIYRIRDDAVTQMTEDHTLIAWQIKQGILTPDEARHSPFRNVITRSVGNHEYVEVDTGVYPVQPGDRYLLCSDGLHGYLVPDEIPAIAALGGASAVERFIELANERGGRDNISAVVVELI